MLVVPSLGPASQGQEGMLRSELVCLEQHLPEDGLQQEGAGGQRRVGKESPHSSRN